MKKKILVYSLSFLSLLTLTGCSNKQSSISSLENQVQRIEKIVTEDNSYISSVSPDMSSYSNTYNSINNHRTNSYNNLTRENSLKKDVLSLNYAIKNSLNKDIKISKSKSNIIKTLTSNISENLSKYNETKGKINNNVKNIKKMLKVSNINVDSAEAEYISLNGNMNERYIYLCNIYDNLEHAYILICENCNDNTQQHNTNSYTDNNTFNKQTQKSRFKKNIDSYLPEKTEESINNKDKKEQKLKNIDSFNNAVPPSRYGYNNNYYYGYNNYNNPYAYNNYNGYGYNGFGYANGGYRRFNPNGNTDTFYPTNRNIDTYRYPANSPVNAQPLEDNEEFKDDTLKENIKQDDLVQDNSNHISIDDEIEEITTYKKDISQNLINNKN